MTKESQNSTVKPDGKAVLKTETDGTVVLSSDKSAFLNMDKILSIGVRNIIDIKNYQPERLEHSTRHFIEFYDGERFSISFLVCKNLSVSNSTPIACRPNLIAAFTVEPEPIKKSATA